MAWPEFFSDHSGNMVVRVWLLERLLAVLKPPCICTPVTNKFITAQLVPCAFSHMPSGFYSQCLNIPVWIPVSPSFTQTNLQIEYHRSVTCMCMKSCPCVCVSAREDQSGPYEERKREREREREREGQSDLSSDDLPWPWFIDSHHAFGWWHIKNISFRSAASNKHKWAKNGSYFHFIVGSGLIISLICSCWTNFTAKKLWCFDMLKKIRLSPKLLKRPSPMLFVSWKR